MEWKRNGTKNSNQVEIKFIGMEWNQNGNGMENFRLKMTMCNGMEMEQNGMEIQWKKLNGMEMEQRWK